MTKNQKFCKKVLIIGDADSVWVKSIIEKTHIPFGDKVSVLTYKNNTFEDFYKKNNINIYFLKSIRSFKGPFNILNNLLKVIKRYDIIIVHFVQPHRALLGCIGNIFSKKLILVFWGSDILRLPKNIIVENAIKKASNIVLGTKEMEERFHKLYGDKYINKIIHVNFGSNGIDSLSKNMYDLMYLRKKYEISNNKVILSIGYSNSHSQQHLKILDVVGKLSKEIKDKIHLMLRLSYGDGDVEYILSIKNKVEEIGCSCTFFETYLSKDEVAETTTLADVFVHALITDARSASMCEHMFAGALVIIPSWIKYDINDKVFSLKYDNFEQLEDILAKNIVKKNESLYKKELIKNRQRIYKICSWKTQIIKWRNLYYL